MLFVLQYSVYFSNESFSFYYISKNKYRPSTNINYEIPEDIERLKNINDSIKNYYFVKSAFEFSEWYTTYTYRHLENYSLNYYC